MPRSRCNPAASAITPSRISFISTRAKSAPGSRCPAQSARLPAAVLPLEVAMQRIAILLALVVAVLAAVWLVTRPEPVAVALVTAGRGPVAATVANTRAGTVDACRRAGLSPALGGQIASLPVKDGERVEAGTLLLELWNDDIEAELTLAERDARASRSRA